MDGVSPADIGHRFVRDADPGPGRILVDILAPEGLSERTNLFTVRPARTVQAPGTVLALERVEVVTVTMIGPAGERAGVVRRPDLLGALVLKAAATALPIRRNPDRDWADAALLLSLVSAPLEMARAASPRELARVAQLRPLLDVTHSAWVALGRETAERGSDALALLLAPAHSAS